MFIGLFICTIISFCESLAFNSKEPIKCVSLDNQPCKSRPTFVNIKSDETLFCPFTVNVNKCGESCNTIDDSHARVCVPNKVKNINVKLFNLMSEVNETRFLFTMNCDSSNVD